MPRIARIYLDQGVFHILSRGNNKQPVFHDASDYHYYKGAVRRMKAEQPFKLYHWCFMSNHVHLMIDACRDTGLSKMMKRLNLIYYAYYKRKYAYAGHFWQDRFKSLLVDTDSYLLACGLYIERNPVRAGIVQSPGAYAYSSYHYYAYGKDDGLTDPDPLYAALGRTISERQHAYRALTLDVQLNLTPDLFNRRFFGSDEFVRQMEAKCAVLNTRIGRGRPRKE